MDLQPDVERRISDSRVEADLKCRIPWRRSRIQLAKILFVLTALLVVLGSPRFSTMLMQGRELVTSRVLQHASLDSETALMAAATQPSGVTIVSAYFMIHDGRKHPVGDYFEWLKNFLHHAEQPIVFFTSPDLVERIVALRQGKPIHVISDYGSAWDMPPNIELGGQAWGEAMNKIDPEQAIHVAGVYGPWTAKPWMLRFVKDMNPYNSRYFFWMDAGGFREPEAKHHLHALPRRLDELYSSIPDDTIVLGDATLYWPAGTEYVKQAALTHEMDYFGHIQAGWFGGLPAALDWWEIETLKVTQIQSGLQRFAGKEQDTWNHAARLFWPKVLVQRMSANNGSCGLDAWFAYEYWADSDECQIPSWNGPALWEAERAQAEEINRLNDLAGIDSH